MTSLTSNVGWLVGSEPKSRREDTSWFFPKSEHFRHSPNWTAVLAGIYFLIFVAGAVGNVTVLYRIFHKGNLRTATHVLVANLGVADLSVILFCVPGTLVVTLLEPWFLGAAMCKLLTYIQGVSIFSSAYSLAAISLDRCKAIYRPMERGRGFNRTQVYLTICLIWAAALLVLLPWVFVFDVRPSSTNNSTFVCFENWGNEYMETAYFFCCNFLASYIFPLLLIGIANHYVSQSVSHREMPQDLASDEQIQELHKKTKTGVQRILCFATFTFLISWLPFYGVLLAGKIFPLILEEKIGRRIVEIVIPFAKLLGTSSSFINPFFYIFRNFSSSPPSPPPISPLRRRPNMRFVVGYRGGRRRSEAIISYPVTRKRSNSYVTSMSRPLVRRRKSSDGRLSVVYLGEMRSRKGVVKTKTKPEVIQVIVPVQVHLEPGPYLMETTV